MRAMMAKEFASDTFPNPKRKPLAHLAGEIHSRQVLQEDGRAEVNRRVCAVIFQELRKIIDTTTLKLMPWLASIFVRAGQCGYFDSRLDKDFPGLGQAFTIFDNLSWQVLFNYPAFFSRTMTDQRNRCLDALESYVSLDQVERPNDVWFIRTMEDNMRSLNISNRDIAKLFFMVYWV